MLINHNSIKLVTDDPILLMPQEERDRRLSLLKQDAQQNLISEKMCDFDIDWIYIADSRTKFRKSELTLNTTTFYDGNIRRRKNPIKH